MIKTIYTRAVQVLMKKPLALWGISLLNVLLAGVVTALCGAVPFIAIGVNMLLSTAMTMIFLRGYRGEEVKCVNLFDFFKDGATAKRILGGLLWMNLWIFLWSLIPVVGPIFAIIRAYEYRLTPYILVTEPEIAPTEAIKVSAERTKGFKGQMFGADILVYVLIFAANLVLGLLAAIPVLGILFGLALLVINIAVPILTPLFIGLVQAAFYEEICASNALICPNCGAKYTAGSVFCANCGNKLD